MKKTLSLLLCIFLLLGSAAGFCEEETEVPPDYAGMEAERVFIGKDVWKDDIFTFPGMNAESYEEKRFTLINLDLLMEILARYRIEYATTYGTAVEDRDYYVIKLMDGSTYALDVFRDTAYNYFITVADLEIFLSRYLGEEVVFEE